MGERINQSKSEKRPGENLARAEERHEKQIDSFVSHLAKPVWMAASVSGLKLWKNNNLEPHGSEAIRAQLQPFSADTCPRFYLGCYSLFFSGLMDPLWSIPKSSFFTFFFLTLLLPPVSLALMISFASTQFYCTALVLPVKHLMCDPSLYIYLYLSFTLPGSCVPLAPLFYELHSSCPALLFTPSVCQTWWPFP